MTILPKPLTGLLKTLGDLLGETKDMPISLLLEMEKEFAESNNMLLTPFGMSDYIYLFNS